MQRDEALEDRNAIVLQVYLGLLESASMGGYQHGWAFRIAMQLLNYIAGELWSS